MPAVSDIAAVMITLKAGDNRALFILLAADGSINRQGTGAVNNQEHDLFIGVTKEPLFDQLMTYLDDEMLRFMGGRDLPDQKGVPCMLSIGFSFRSADDNGFGFRYGSESIGPPHEIVQFVTAAVQLTNPWFNEFKQAARKSESGKKNHGKKKQWWRFW